MNRKTVLLVEDDRAIRRGMKDLLAASGYAVLECADGPSGLATALGSAVDLALLDVFLPGMSGFDLLEKLRAEKPGLPIIMVTARGAEDDRVRGLERGADDYVVKPFSAKELLARVQAVLRRSAERAGGIRHLRAGGVAVDLERREADLGGGAALTLSDKEVLFLRYLAEARGRAVTREELLLRVWGIDPVGLETRAVDMLVKRLREKLAAGRGDDPFIRTVRAKGYMLAAAVEVDGA